MESYGPIGMWLVYYYYFNCQKKLHFETGLTDGVFLAVMILCKFTSLQSFQQSLKRMGSLLQCRPSQCNFLLGILILKVQTLTLSVNTQKHSPWEQTKIGLFWAPGILHSQKHFSPYSFNSILLWVYSKNW